MTGAEIYIASFLSSFRCSPVMFLILGSPMAATANLARWLIILPVQMSADVKSFVEQLIKVGRAQHFNIPDPKV